MTEETEQEQADRLGVLTMNVVQDVVAALRDSPGEALVVLTSATWYISLMASMEPAVVERVMNATHEPTKELYAATLGARETKQ